MAQAIKELYPDAKFFVGPVVDEGFYYDFRTSQKISEADLKKIEKKMKELAKKGYEIEKYTISKDEAREKFKDDDLKQRVLDNIPSDEVSIYKQGEFEDLCRGPHVPTTKKLFNVKLTRVAGAYLGGDENEEMLTRIYGIAFADKESLKKHITMLEEAKTQETTESLVLSSELSMSSEAWRCRLAAWLPKGARLRSKIEQIHGKLTEFVATKPSARSRDF